MHVTWCMTLLHQLFQFPVCFCTFALYVSLTFWALNYVCLGTHHDTSCVRLCRKNKYKHCLSCCFILLYRHHNLLKIITQVAGKLVLLSFLVICLNPTSLDAIWAQLLLIQRDPGNSNSEGKQKTVRVCRVSSYRGRLKYPIFQVNN